MAGKPPRNDKLKRDTGTLKTIQKLKRKTTVDSEKSFDLDRGSGSKDRRHQINQVKD